MQCFCYTPRGLKLKLTSNYSLDTLLQNTFAEETLFAYNEVNKNAKLYKVKLVSFRRSLDDDIRCYSFRGTEVISAGNVLIMQIRTLELILAGSRMLTEHNILQLFFLGSVIPNSVLFELLINLRR